MNAIENFLQSKRKVVYVLLLLFCFLPMVTPPVALFTGLVFALVCGEAFPGFTKKSSKYLLQVSVVGLGFGMNLHESLASGREGMVFTVISVVGTLLIGSVLARRMQVDRKTGYLISSGTAICGGSAGNQGERPRDVCIAGSGLYPECRGVVLISGTGASAGSYTTAVWYVGCHCDTRYKLGGGGWCGLWRRGSEGGYHR